MEPPVFSDADDTSAYAAAAIEELARAGLISGAGGRLNARADSTRAECAQFIYNVLTGRHL